VVALAMSDARAEVMARIRTALGSSPVSVDVPRAYRGAGAPVAFDVVERFCERVADYDATVHRVGAAELGDALAAACRERGARRVVVAPGAGWRVDGVELVADDPPLEPRQLDGVDGVISGCALAVAETGSIVLDGDALSGRRAITLVPDLHLCVVGEDQIVPAVPDAIAALGPGAAEGRPITFVSGPSATADIELIRVQGVHGPRTLDVFVVSG
jgi:L-lactate dehydrogenase complex protein LldG